jgi:hypothetical protein
VFIVHSFIITTNINQTQYQRYWFFPDKIHLFAVCKQIILKQFVLQTFLAFTIIRKSQFRYDFFFSPIMFQPNKAMLFMLQMSHKLCIVTFRKKRLTKLHNSFTLVIKNHIVLCIVRNKTNSRRRNIDSSVKTFVRLCEIQHKWTLIGT